MQLDTVGQQVARDAAGTLLGNGRYATMIMKRGETRLL